MNRFLLIDDDEMINYIHRQVILSVLPDADIITLTSSTEALGYFKNMAANKNDEDHYFVFIDINMPELNGFQLLESISHLIPSENACNFYMVSSSLFDSDREKAMSFSFIKGFKEKPLSKNDIREMIS